MTEKGRAAGIDAYVLLNPGHRGPVTDKVMANAVEAIIGAVYLDSGKDMESAKKLMMFLNLRMVDAV